MFQIRQKFRMLNEARKNKTIVFILSAMRSGSTLLKALLANAPDTSHLPEVNWQHYNDQNAWKLKTLSPKKIIILKKPSPFEPTSYPFLPKVSNPKYIILVRDVYDTVKSMKAMFEQVYPEVAQDWPYERIIEYWCITYECILEALSPKNQDVCILQYEQLTNQPLVHTARLFSFIGSKQKQGVDQYQRPTQYEWKWGVDDGGEKLKSLRVKPSVQTRLDLELVSLIQYSARVQQICEQLNISYS